LYKFCYFSVTNIKNDQNLSKDVQVQYFKTLSCPQSNKGGGKNVATRLANFRGIKNYHLGIVQAGHSRLKQGNALLGDFSPASKLNQDME
jgi:hypothetical protein